MAKWAMPHEMNEEPSAERPAPSPTKMDYRFIMPHEVEKPVESESPELAVLRGESAPTRLAIGIGERLQRAGRGLKQRVGMVRNLLPGEPSAWPEEVAAEHAAEEPYRAAIGKDPMASVGNIVGEVALGSLGGVGKTALANAAKAAAAGALTEGILNPDAEPTWGNFLTGAGKGALAGGIGGAATGAAVSALARGKNAFQGKFADPEHARRFSIFKREGVPASMGDLTQDPFIMSMENTAQHIPFTGRKEFLEQQARKVADKINQAPEAIVGSVPSGTKEDLGKAIAESIRTKYAANKQEAGRLYDAVSQRVQAVGAPPVDTQELARTSKELLDKYPTIFAKLADDPTTVEAITAIARGTHAKASTILDASGKPVMKAPKLSFDELRTLDSDLGSMIRQGRILTGRGEFNNKAFKQLVDLQNALRKDIETWAGTVGDPEIAKGITQANTFYREEVVPFRKNKTIRSVIQDEHPDTDSLPGLLFRPDSPSRAEQALSFMTPEGAQAGRYYMVKEARDKAMNDALEADYSPKRFLSGSQLGETGPKLLTEPELGKLADLREMVKASRRASTYGFDPSTGNRLLSLSPLMGPKLPALAKLFALSTQSEKPVRYMLANPRAYTGASPLGMTAENLVRKSGIGLGTGNFVTDDIE